MSRSDSFEINQAKIICNSSENNTQNKRFPQKKNEKAVTRGPFECKEFGTWPARSTCLTLLRFDIFSTSSEEERRDPGQASASRLRWAIKNTEPNLDQFVMVVLSHNATDLLVAVGQGPEPSVSTMQQLNKEALLYIWPTAHCCSFIWCSTVL